MRALLQPSLKMRRASACCLRSKDSGAANGFRVQASVDADANPTDDAGFRLAFDPETGAFGMGSGSPSRCSMPRMVGPASTA